MKFSEMLGEPDPEREVPQDPEPISVFAPAEAPPPPTAAEFPPLPPDPESPPRPALPGPAMPAPPLSAPFAAPDAPRSGFAEVNVVSPATAPTESLEGIAPADELAELPIVDDDLLPSARRARK
jgi:hypothetical protein